MHGEDWTRRSALYTVTQPTSRSAAITIVLAPAAEGLIPTATLKSPSLFSFGQGRRTRCSSALAAQSPPPRSPGELPFGTGVAPRSQNAPAVRGKPKWRRAVAKWSVFEAGLRRLTLLSTLVPRTSVCACACAGARWGGCPVGTWTRRGSAQGDVIGCFFLYEAVGTTEVTE